MFVKHLLFKFAVVLLFSSLTASTSVFACTLFVMHDDSTVVFGRTLDWDNPIPGMVFVNPRGEQKTVLPWHGSWPVTGEWESVAWTSSYGSVTFSAYGRDFIASGMNEVGLVVAEASWISEYGPADDRPGISCAQWLQYQLDRCKSVADVVSHVNDLRLDGEGWHFLIADARGDVAVIEYQDCKPVVILGSELRYPVLTNAGCSQLEKHLELDVRFGGTADIGTGDDSYGRYLRAAAMLRDKRLDMSPVTIEDAWRMMDSVRVSDTRREIVFDSKNRTVFWMTDASRTTRVIDLMNLQFDPGSSVLMLDVDGQQAGDVSQEFQPYSVQWNRKIVQAAMRAILWDNLPNVSTTPSGFTFDQVVELIATHPK